MDNLETRQLYLVTLETNDNTLECGYIHRITKRDHSVIYTFSCHPSFTNHFEATLNLESSSLGFLQTVLTFGIEKPQEYRIKFLETNFNKGLNLIF